MSTAVLQDYRCLCGQPLVGVLADSASATRAPWMRQAILDGEFHRLRCTRCRRSVQVEKELLYTDFGRKHWIGVFPPADFPRFHECSELCATTFQEAMFERAAPILASWAPGFSLRVVFGMDALREKLLCWNANLDDGVLELLKLDILNERPDLQADGLLTVRLDWVFEDGALGFTPVYWKRPADPTKCRALWMPPGVYQTTLEARPALAEAHAAMLAGPFVDVLRYFAPPPPPAGSPRSSTDRRIWRAGRP